MVELEEPVRPLLGLALQSDVDGKVPVVLVLLVVVLPMVDDADLRRVVFEQELVRDALKVVAERLGTNLVHGLLEHGFGDVVQ